MTEASPKEKTIPLQGPEALLLTMQEAVKPKERRHVSTASCKNGSFFLRAEGNCSTPLLEAKNQKPKKKPNQERGGRQIKFVGPTANFLQFCLNSLHVCKRCPQASSVDRMVTWAQTADSDNQRHFATRPRHQAGGSPIHCG